MTTAVLPIDLVTQPAASRALEPKGGSSARAQLGVQHERERLLVRPEGEAGSKSAGACASSG